MAETTFEEYLQDLFTESITIGFTPEHIVLGIDLENFIQKLPDEAKETAMKFGKLICFAGEHWSLKVNTKINEDCTLTGTIVKEKEE